MPQNLPKLPLVRFYRRIPLIPGMLWLNVFKWGVSLSIGTQGFRITLGKSNLRGTIGLTGTGLFLTKNIRHSVLSPSENVALSSDDQRTARINKLLGKSHGKKEI